MQKAKVRFSNGEELTLQNGDVFVGLASCNVEGETCSSVFRRFEMIPHHNFGLIPGVMDMVYSCDFFSDEEEKKVYSTKHVVSVERISN